MRNPAAGIMAEEADAPVYDYERPGTSLATIDFLWSGISPTSTETS